MRGEKQTDGVSRRDFLKTAGAGTLAVAAAGSTASPRPASAAAGRPVLAGGTIKLGSVSWNFRGINAGPPWTDPIDIHADLGFEGTEVICARPEQLDATLAEPHYSNLMRQLERRKMAISQFVLFQPLVADLGSPDAEKRKLTIDIFAKACRVADKVNAPMINIVAPWPTVYHKEGYGYLPRYYSTGTTMPGPKFAFDVPRDFDWAQAWSEFVATMKETTAAAKAAGLLFSLENHTHTFVQGPDAFLQLWNEVRDPTLGMNLDIGWLQLQREYPVVGIYKVRDHLMNLHLRDIDGFAYRFVAPGAGCMDFEGVIRTLRAIGFTGFLTFEQDGVPDMKQALSRGREIIQELLARTA
jgi:sugar phosphate isomerase/epimerase